ncbi:hypothetical protein GIB67_035699 [Kingdonia uniflora]|uniref:Uncharacterized protein n=1 Tax=Kingdonia uniflora TaxID=39325 RepID=A0A7J7NKB8_9MAGN|nr:hypothetical protein GIB67_036622 [Kingdonia uniflora]KAF6167424.1 hypothetical protein GIB67_035699 [Kingdonia uniflora]
MPNRRASGLSGGCESSDHEKLSGNLHAQPQTKGVAPLVQQRVKGGQRQQLLVSTEAPSETLQHAGCLSKSLRSHLCPDMGKNGFRCLVEDFFTELPDKDLQYNVLVTPEVASQGVDSTVMSQCISLYRNALPTLVETQSVSEGFAAYYVRKSLSTVGSQPLTSKDFLMSLINEADGI